MRRPGRPASTKEDILRMKIEALQKEQRDGFCEYMTKSHSYTANPSTDMPDLTDEKTVEMLERWEGLWTYLSNLNWVRISASGSVNPAKFPPQTN